MAPSGKTNNGEDGDEVKWTAWDWFTTILEVLIGIAAISALVVSTLAYQKAYGIDDIGSKPVFTSVKTTTASVSGALVAGSTSTGLLTVGTPASSAVRSRHALASEVFPLKVDATGFTSINNLTVVNFACTGTGCPSSPSSITVDGSFPITTDGVTSTFSKAGSLARLSVSEVHSPDTTGLLVRGGTGVSVKVGVEEILAVTATSVTLTGATTITGTATVTGALTAPTVKVGTATVIGSTTTVVSPAVRGTFGELYLNNRNVTSATSVCGNNIVEPGEQCDSTFAFCTQNCHYAQIFPYIQVAGALFTPTVTTTIGVLNTIGKYAAPFAGTNPSEYGPIAFFDSLPTDLTARYAGIQTISNVTSVQIKLDFTIGFTTSVSAGVLTCGIYSGLTEALATTLVSAPAPMATGVTSTLTFSQIVTTDATINTLNAYRVRCTNAGATVDITVNSYTGSATVLSYPNTPVA